MLPDQRILCGLCRQTQIATREQALRNFLQVTEDLFRLGLRRIRIDFPVRLVDTHRLQKAGNEQDRLGVTSKLQQRHISGITDNTIDEILILSHLSQNHFCAVAAHEFGHAWMHLEDFPPLPPLVEEGLCELLAYRWLKDQNNPETKVYATRMLSNDHPIYGEGFRQARASSHRIRLPKLLEWVKDHGELPG